MSTNFLPHHVSPEGRTMLAFSCVLPETWVSVPTPGEELDLDNPGVFIPLLVCMAPYGAVVFSIAARPAFDDGSVQEWAEYLAAQQNLAIEQVREARVNRMPCIVIDATMPSDVGLMRSRSVFLEDGKRLFNIGTLAPDAIWPSVEGDLNRLLGSFALDDVQGITAAPLREMSSGPVIDLSADSRTTANPGATETTAPGNDTSGGEHVDTDSTNESVGETDASETSRDAAADSENLPAPAADLALADDAETLDAEHPLNVRLRDSGAGLVPRVLHISLSEKFATVGAGAIESIFDVPLGWHVIDDGRRTLVFDVKGNVQINMNLRSIEDSGIHELLTSIGDELARENPQALFLKLEMQGMPCLAIRDLVIDGDQLDQAYFARPSHRENLALVCRVTATRDEMTRAVNTAEMILMSFRAPAGAD